MKILVVSNLYPPHHVGGYELGCQDVVNRLRKRGHFVHVLSGDFRRSDVAFSEVSEGIERILTYSSNEIKSPPNDVLEAFKLHNVLRKIRPDIVYFWCQSGLSPWLSFVAKSLGYRMAFFISDTAFVSWRIAAWLARAGQRYRLIHQIFKNTFLIKGIPIIKDGSCHFASYFLERLNQLNSMGIQQNDSVVIHWGIDPTLFRENEMERSRPIKRLLYVGQISPLKGVHTVISAVANLARYSKTHDITLSILGGCYDREYQVRLENMCRELNLTNKVKFVGSVARTELPYIYQEHDVLIFSSEWEEPFAITPLEAAACGLPIVSTLTGGTGEFLENNITGVTFKAGDAEDCAKSIMRLLDNEHLQISIRENAKCKVLKDFTIEQMVDKIETNLASN